MVLPLQKTVLIIPSSLYPKWCSMVQRYSLKGRSHRQEAALTMLPVALFFFYPKSTSTALSMFCCRYHDVASSRGYEALLRETLREGVVDEEGRAALRKHRLANEIDSLHHVRVLKKLGWTLDDLEEGRKMDPPTAEDPVTKSSPSVPLADSLGQTPAQLEKENAALRNALSGSGDTPSSS